MSIFEVNEQFVKNRQNVDRESMYTKYPFYTSDGKIKRAGANKKMLSFGKIDVNFERIEAQNVHSTIRWQNTFLMAHIWYWLLRWIRNDLSSCPFSYSESFAFLLITIHTYYVARAWVLSAFVFYGSSWHSWELQFMGLEVRNHY